MKTEQSEQRELAVASHGEQDAANAMKMPSAIPESWTAEEFIEPVLPDAPFVIRNLRDATESEPFAPSDFIPDADGVMSAHTRSTGAHVVLRVIYQEGATLNCVDDQGEVYMCVVVTLADNTLAIEEPISS